MPFNATVIFGSLLQSHAAELLLYYMDNLVELMSFIIAGMVGMHLAVCAPNMQENTTYKSKFSIYEKCQILLLFSLVAGGVTFTFDLTNQFKEEGIPTAMKLLTAERNQLV